MEKIAAPKSSITPRTLVDLLRWRADNQDLQRAYSFLSDGESQKYHLSYSELDKRARAIATYLEEIKAAGERALLLYSPGLEYINAFFGCLYAGVIAVPVYPPRLNRPSPRIQNIMTDAQATIALTTGKILKNIERRFEHAQEMTKLNWLDTDEIPDAIADQWRQPSLADDSVAFLQYTSGSTNRPRGVMISHGNVMHNLSVIHHGFNIGDEDSGVIWLPLYHDAGLIGGILEPLFAGIPALLMPPAAFFQKPVRWLQAISAYHGTISGAPNFAYQLCVEKITKEQCLDLDLSSWLTAFCGAEPIRKETLLAFAKKFEPYGFCNDAFYPAYGLAENTLMVTCGNSHAATLSRSFSLAAIERGQVKTVEPDHRDAVDIVSCGRTWLDQEIVIVNPQTKRRCESGRIGEVWVAGSSVAQGYWRQKELTDTTFHARLAEGGEEFYLRTGDLGFLYENELYITGRIKDLIIIRGRNHFPQDIELTVAGSHKALESDSGATFSVDVDGEERLVIVHELTRRHRKTDPEQIVTAVRQAVSEVHGLQLYALVLLKPFTIPRTSSGKIMRYACKMGFRDGTLQEIVRWLAPEHPDRQSEVTEASSHAYYTYVDLSTEEWAWAFDESAQTPIEASLEPDGKRKPGAPQAPKTKPGGQDHDLNSPVTPIEIAMAEVWAQTLNLSEVGRHDTFFALGGDSLQVFQIIAGIRNLYEVEVGLSDFYDNPTVAGLSQCVENAIRLGEKITLESIPTAPRDAPVPLSFSQERMWFIHQLQPENSAYNIPLAIRLSGRLDAMLLEQCLNEIVQRHEILRTNIIMIDGRPVQQVQSALAVRLPVHDLRHQPESTKEEQLWALIRSTVAQPFDLVRGPLLRACLIRLADEEHVFVGAIHHIAIDAWSLGVLGHEIATLYEAYNAGQKNPLLELPFQYADFASWQRQWFTGERLKSHLHYWRQKLVDIPVLSLPTDKTRLAFQTFQGAVESLTPSVQLFNQLKALSRENDVTFFITLLAAFKVLLHRYAGQIDFAVGVPVANRQWPGSERLVGTFVNNLVLRIDLSNDPTFREFLSRVRDVLIEAFTHQDLPFDKLVADLPLERDASHSPLYQVLFNYISLPTPDTEFGGLTWEHIEIDRGGAQVDLNLSIIETKEFQQILLEYDTSLFYASTASRLLDNFLLLLEGIVAEPDTRLSKLPLLRPTERRRLLVEWNDTRVEYPSKLCLHRIIEVKVRRVPKATAVEFDDKRLSYEEINQRANQLARYLRGVGVGPGKLVGIGLNRSAEMLIALLGVLKSGGAYVPLDPDFPEERLALMLDDARPAALITEQQLVDEGKWGVQGRETALICLDSMWALITQMPSDNLPIKANANDTAYVIYTSGSTGRPKGVQISHRAIVNFLASMARQLGMSAADTILAITTLSFDIAALELFLPLTLGGRVVIADQAMVYDGARLQEALVKYEATIMQATPATWRLLLESGWSGDSKLKILCGGEKLPRNLANQLVPRCAELWNMYGPTETTVWSTIYRVTTAEGPVPIGRPIANTQIYILDKNMEPVPIGVVGDLYIGGDGVAIGYLNRPQLTAERFWKNPFVNDDGFAAQNHSPVIYRTGDKARYLGDGNILFLGRDDHQVKIRGFRIELGEVEAALAQHPGVHQNVVISREDRSGNNYLVAYVVPKDKPPPSTSSLSRFLMTKLPTYMIPSKFVVISALPLTPNSKVNRLALPDPDLSRPDLDELFVTPRTPIEVRLAEIWSDVLNLERVGIHDNFFELGGHSLLAVHLFNQIETKMGRPLPLTSIFMAPTIAQLADVIEQEYFQVDSPILVPIQPMGSKPAFYFVHGFGGGVLGYGELARLLGQDQPIYGLQAEGIDGKSSPATKVEAMAASYLRAVRDHQPSGPYLFGGYCLGGIIAFEMARQLQDQGEETALVAIMEGYGPRPKGQRSSFAVELKHARNFLRNLPFWFQDFVQLGITGMLARIAQKVRLAGKWVAQTLGRPVKVDARDFVEGDISQVPDHQIRIMESQVRSLWQYSPTPYDGRVTLLRTKGQSLLRSPDFERGWGKLASGGVEVRLIAGYHRTIMEQPHVQVLAEQLEECIDQALSL